MPSWHRVLCETITAFGAARLCRRAARFGVSPVTISSCAAHADQIADHDETGGDADAHLQRLAQAERGDRLDNRETAAHGALGIILMRQRVAEIGQYAVAHQSGDKATVAGHYLGDAEMIGGDDVAQVLWIEPYG